MKTFRTLSTLSALAVLGGAAVLAAPQARDAKPEPLLPHADLDDAAHAAQRAFDAEGWKSRLQSPDLRERLGAFDALVAVAGGNAAAREALAGWAADASSPELAWTAMLAQRELDRRPAAAQPFGSPFPHGDVFADPFRGFGGHGSIDALFDRLRAEMDALRGGAFSGPGAMQALPPGSFQSSQRGFRFEQTPDGVKVEIQENVDGKDETRTYEAESLEELLAAHPELGDRLQPGARAPFSIAPSSPFGDLDDDDGFFLRPAVPSPLVPDVLQPRTDRLGVQVREPASDAEAGLLVVEVLPGSLGELLGVRAGDVIAKLGGKAVRSVDDVRRGLAERAADAPIVLEVIGSDGASRTLTWRPAAAAPRVKPGRQA